MNVFDYAMKLEQDGKAFYLDLAAQSPVPGVKNIFTMLAADEQKHYETFQELKEKNRSPAMLDSSVLEQTKGIFEKLMGQRQEMVSLEGSLKVYERAMAIEAESVRLYEDAAAKETRAEVKKLLLRIAKEEQKHFNILDNLYQFANAPNQFLAWGEFSNIGEFHQFGRDVDR